METDFRCFIVAVHGSIHYFFDLFAFSLIYELLMVNFGTLLRSKELLANLESMEEGIDAG
jgi:hypothetical protein